VCAGPFNAAFQQRHTLDQSPTSSILAPGDSPRKRQRKQRLDDLPNESNFGSADNNKNCGNNNNGKQQQQSGSSPHRDLVPNQPRVSYVLPTIVDTKPALVEHTKQPKPRVKSPANSAGEIHIFSKIILGNFSF